MLKNKLSDIVKELLDEEDRITTHEFGRYMRIARRGYIDLWSDALGVMQVDKIKVDATTNTAPLPENFVKEEGVYYLTSSGELVILSRNDDFYWDKDNCGIISSPQDSPTVALYTGVESSFRITKDGRAAGGHYGAKGVSIYGQYSIDRNNGLILLSTDYCHEYVYLRYLGNPKAVNEDFYVHPWANEAIKSWVYWKEKDRKSSVGANEKEYWRSRYYDEKFDLQTKLFTMGAQEQVDTSRRNVTPTAKF